MQILNTETIFFNFNQNNSIQELKLYFGYDMIRRIEHYFQYKKQNLMKNEEYQIVINFLMITDSILIILYKIFDSLENSMDNTVSSLQLAFILTIAMSVFNVIILVPIQIIGVKILDKQLKICSHFQREKLQQMHQRIIKLISS